MAKLRNNNNVRQRARFDDSDNNANYIRSRTISSYSPQPDNAEPNNAVLERSQKQQRSSAQSRKATVFAVIGVIVGLVLIIAMQFVVEVSSVKYEQSGISIDRSEEYLAFVNQYFVDHPAERILWFLDNDEFSAEVEAVFPEISDITVKNEIFGKSNIELLLRKPVAVWSSGNKRSYIDENGDAFDKNYFDEPDITIIDQSSTNLSSRMLEFIGKTIFGIDESGVGTVKEVNIPVSAARYVEMKLIDRDFAIKVQIDRDINSQITDIVNMVKFLDERGINPSYIDVRVKNRGYYK